MMSQKNEKTYYSLQTREDKLQTQLTGLGADVTLMSLQLVEETCCLALLEMMAAPDPPGTNGFAEAIHAQQLSSFDSCGFPIWS